MAVLHFTATKAFLTRDGKVLILRESDRYQDGHHQSFYDVPGGRIEPGEELLAALTREVREETGLGFNSAVPFYESTRQLPRGEDVWEIRRIYYACDASPGEVILSDDHDHYEWIAAEDDAAMPIIPDLAEVFDAYRAFRDKR